MQCARALRGTFIMTAKPRTSQYVVPPIAGAGLPYVGIAEEVSRLVHEDDCGLRAGLALERLLVGVVPTVGICEVNSRHGHREVVAVLAEVDLPTQVDVLLLPASQVAENVLRWRDIRSLSRGRSGEGGSGV